MRLKSLFTLILGALALVVMTAAARPADAQNPGAQSEASQKNNGQGLIGTGEGVGVGAGESTACWGLGPIGAVSEIDAAALKKLLEEQPLRHRPLLINFWATWCEPCREEFPDLVRIDNDYRPRGLNFVTVSLDDVTEIKTSVPQFLIEMKAPMPAYLLNPPDADAVIALVDKTWGGGLPATFLFNSRGEIVFKQMGRVKVADLRAAIEKVISGK